MTDEMRLRHIANQRKAMIETLRAENEALSSQLNVARASLLEVEASREVVIEQRDKMADSLAQCREAIEVTLQVKGEELDKWLLTPNAKHPTLGEYLRNALASSPSKVEKTLDVRMKAAGMQTIDEMLSSLTDEPLLLQAEVVDIQSFEGWLEMKCREFNSMQARMHLDKRLEDELYEWVLAHAALFKSVLAHYRKATSPPSKVEETP